MRLDMPEAWPTNPRPDIISAGHLQAGLAACEPWCLAQKSTVCLLAPQVTHEKYDLRDEKRGTRNQWLDLKV